MHGLNQELTFKDKLNAQYKEIVQASHTNSYILNWKLFKFSLEF